MVALPCVNMFANFYSIATNDSTTSIGYILDRAITQLESLKCGAGGKSGRMLRETMDTPNKWLPSRCDCARLFHQLVKTGPAIYASLPHTLLGSWQLPDAQPDGGFGTLITGEATSPPQPGDLTTTTRRPHSYSNLLITETNIKPPQLEQSKNFQILFPNCDSEDRSQRVISAMARHFTQAIARAKWPEATRLATNLPARLPALEGT
ncbi:hypothetical protein DFH27DRAFT_602987 [Peziza echinospora]|nr:hypothetical protein DFH27DRAFT_602987 [Peziza echinospora]